MGVDQPHCVRTQPSLCNQPIGPVDQPCFITLPSPTPSSSSGQSRTVDVMRVWPIINPSLGMTFVKAALAEEPAIVISEPTRPLAPLMR